MVDILIPPEKIGMVESLRFTSAAISDRGLSEKRPQNEDSFIELESYGVFAVADGVGGAQAGDVASQMAVEILAEAFVNMSPDADPEDTMKAAIDQANTSIFQMANDLPQLSSMATTVVALHVSGGIATIAHVGDSRIYRVDSNGLIHRETQDHSVVEEEVRAGRMTPEQALNHPSRNVISRALGAEETVEIDTKMMIIHPATTFLLCSDGITRHIDDNELAAYLALDEEPTVICGKLREVCYSRGAEDNLTAVIVRFRDAETVQPPVLHSANDAEQEQVTIAAARPPFDSVAEPSEKSYEFKSRESIDEEWSQRTSDEPYLLANGADLGLDEPDEDTMQGEYTSSSVIVPAAVTASENIRPAVSPLPKSLEETESRGSFPGVLGMLAMLVLGALLGAGGYYLYNRSQPVAVAPVIPPISEMKSNDTPLTSFEEGRRLVDADPAKYIAAKAASPQEAGDYYLLGRAFMLVGKYWEADRSFGEAKNRLAQVDPSNSKTLAGEIAIGMAVVQNAQSQRTLSRELQGSDSQSAPASIANSAASTTRPVR